MLLAAAPMTMTLTQTALPPPAQAVFVTAADVRSMVEEYPGGNTSIRSVDAGDHVVDFWLEQRSAGLRATHGERAESHAELTEIYYIVSGEATLVTGGDLIDPQYRDRFAGIEFPGGAKFMSPTYGGAFTGGEARDVGPGDVLVMPPGTVHQWTSVGSEPLVYVIVRIDPAHRQAAGYANPALQQ